MQHGAVDINKAPCLNRNKSTVLRRGKAMRVRDMPQIIVRTPLAVKEWLEQKAAEEERSQNWIAVKILEEAMKRDEQRSQK